ncbi:MAG: hypothetical protein ABI379_05575 [Rhodanobacter sp.]
MKNRYTPIRWLVVIALLGAVVAFFALGLQHQVNLEALKARQHDLEAFRLAHALWLTTGLFLAYVAVTKDRLQGFFKVLAPPGKDRILGATIVGAHAGEMLAEFVLAVRARARIERDPRHHPRLPTWAEANKYAAGNWKKAHAPERVLGWLARYHTWRRR